MIAAVQSCLTGGSGGSSSSFGSRDGTGACAGAGRGTAAGVGSVGLAMEATGGVPAGGGGEGGNGVSEAISGVSFPFLGGTALQPVQIPKSQPAGRFAGGRPTFRDYSNLKVARRLTSATAAAWAAIANRVRWQCERSCKPAAASRRGRAGSYRSPSAGIAPAARASRAPYRWTS